MYHIVYSSEKINSQILKEINDTKEDNAELQLFDKIKILMICIDTSLVIDTSLFSTKKRSLFSRLLLSEPTIREKCFRARTRSQG
jgi:hypothetical protein